MRVAHVNFVLEPMVGINAKIAQQARAAREAGLPIDFIVVNAQFDHSEENLHYRRLPELSVWESRVCRDRALHKLGLIERVAGLDDFGAVVLRYTGPYPRSAAFLRRYGPKLITEHHSCEVPEMLTYNSQKRWVWACIERWSARRLLSHVRGIIGVTDEIRRYEVVRAGRERPSLVMANGIRTDEIPFTGFRPFDGKTLELVFAATDFTPWQGLERLMEGMLRHQGPEVVRLHLAGKLFPHQEKLIARLAASPHRVVAHGVLRGESLETLYRAANLGIGSLGLYVKRMEEACALKTRDYCARGLPFIYGYRDPDIKLNAPFALRVPNEPAPVDLQRVMAFARCVSSTEGLARHQRTYAEKHLEWSAKLALMYDFVTRVCASATVADGRRDERGAC